MRRAGVVPRGGEERDTSVPQPSGSWAKLESLIEDVERDALRAYRHLGLPTQPGFYVRDGNKWRRTHTPMTPAERWDYLLDNPGARPWDLVGLPELGAKDDSAMGRKAGALLRAATELRFLSDNGGRDISPEALGAAVRLGQVWEEVRRLLPEASVSGRRRAPTR